jgi:hypothetical protein
MSYETCFWHVGVYLERNHQTRCILGFGSIVECLKLHIFLSYLFFSSFILIDFLVGSLLLLALVLSKEILRSTSNALRCYVYPPPHDCAIPTLIGRAAVMCAARATALPRNKKDTQPHTPPPTTPYSTPCFFWHSFD